MPYLSFQKSELVNLENSLYKEILRTNRAGSYSSSSITGCNTRKYHGLLVCPLSRHDMTRYVLLSSLDAAVVQHNEEFNLGIHDYGDNYFEPKGHKYIRNLELALIPRKIYRVGGVLLSVEEILVEKEEHILVKYTLLEANSDTKLKLRPFLANRSVHDLTFQNLEANTKFVSVNDGIRIKMYPDIPALYMQMSKKSEFVAYPHWCCGVEYFKERLRGYPYKEDLYVPGYFEVDIKKGESVIFSASLKEMKPIGFKTRFTKEVNKRISRDDMFSNLLNSAQQFFVTNNRDSTMVAGYHWYKSRLRDTLIASPVLTESLDDIDMFLKVLQSSAKEINDRISDKNNKNIVQADTPLWLFWTIQQCWGKSCRVELWNLHKNILKLILNTYLTGRFDNVRVDSDGLIQICDENTPLTWMNAYIDGKPVTPRNGKCVEINALWYNALNLYLSLAKDDNDGEFIGELQVVVKKLDLTYLDTFWNEEDKCLYDLVDGELKDASIRPNQIFTTAFEYSPLNNEQKKHVIDVVKEELLTEKGLRSLSPKSAAYVGVTGGIADEREVGLHQGTVWPWLIAFYAEGYLKLHKESGVSHIKRIVDGFEEEMVSHCIGTLSEYYDGNPPQMGKGAVSMATNVAGVLKIIKLIKKNS